MIESCYTSFVNLDSRPDRLRHMEKELSRVGISAVRQRGIPWRECDLNNPKHRTMLNRTPGALGCHLSQVEVMKKAFEQNKHAWVMEDDLIFASDFQDRLKYIDAFVTGKNWDVIWLGGTFHQPPFWHPLGPSKMNPDCSARLGKDFDHTNDPRIKKTYGAFCTYAYIVNRNSIEKILALFDDHVHESIGIDWLFIKLQPKLNCYAFVPGSVKQMDNMSDIGTGMTIFSGFSKLNGSIENSRYWFADKMDDFNPQSFKWK